jgi:hypothetical protein
MSVNRNVQFVRPFDDVNWPTTRVWHEKFWADADHMDSCVSYSASVNTGVAMCWDDRVPFCYSITDICFTQNTRAQHTKQDKIDYILRLAVIFRSLLGTLALLLLH